MSEIQASKDTTDNAERFTCPALRIAIKDKEVAEAMSNELMATIRNNTSIPEDKRYKIIGQINAKTRQEAEMKGQLQGMERTLDCPIPEERIAGLSEKEFIEDQRSVYIATYHTEPSKAFLESAIGYAKYMEIVDKRRDDPRVKGNR